MDLDADPRLVEQLAAGLRSQAADLSLYAGMLLTAVAGALPAELVVVERARRGASRLFRGKPPVVAVTVTLGSWSFRLEDLKPGSPGGLFTSDLTVNEFLLVKEAGFQPLGLVLGTSVHHVGLQIGRWSRNQELDVLSQAMYHARELAMTRMEAEADVLGADGIVGVRLEVEIKEWGGDIAEFLAVDTAVKADVGAPAATWRNVKGMPFTSDLSGQDFFTLIRTGYAPLGLTMGTCVYHVAHRSLGSALGTVGQNAELPLFTQALYDARELAMTRMQAEAEDLHAEGIVGMQLHQRNHGWGAHTTEFMAIGTAVRPYRDDHVIERPQLVLGLDR